MIYGTGKLLDMQQAKNIAETVRRLFGKENRLEKGSRSLGRPHENQYLRMDIYNFHGATVVVREWDIIDSNADQDRMGTVHCKWKCNNKLVHKYIHKCLEDIDGMQKDQICHGLPH